MDFPSNSQNKEPKKEKVVEKVVTGKVINRKKPLGQRFRGVFARGEFKQAVQFVTVDVLLPSLRNLVVDATSKGIERLVYGDTNPRRNRGYGAGLTTRVLYNEASTRYSDRRPSAMLPGQPPRGAIGPSRRKPQDDIILASKTDAETTLERLADLIDQYEVASVADLNDLLGLPATYVDNNWGWTHLHGADVVQIREGYLLQLPPIEQL